MISKLKKKWGLIGGYNSLSWRPYNTFADENETCQSTPRRN
jgi:hypothetical protein